MKNLLLLLSLFSVASFAQEIYGPSVSETDFSFKASFVADIVREDGTKSDAAALAQEHFNYVYGILKTKELTKSFGINYNKVEGFGGPKEPTAITVLSSQKVKDSDGKLTRLQVSYSAKGRMLLHKDAAQEILKTGTLEIPLPLDLETIYDKKCTDPHYNSYGDFWYFWDPFGPGCKPLSRAPLSDNVKVSVKARSSRKLDMNPHFDILRSDNLNGSVFGIYVFHGFSDGSRARGDEGRANFKLYNSYLKKLGFDEEVIDKDPTRPLNIYRKKLTNNDGKAIDVEIHHRLVDTQIDAKTVTFAKDFKVAVEEGDVVIYDGHSGLGGNLDIDALEEKASGKKRREGFNFVKAKHQLYFFNSCSSYSYYLQPFFDRKSTPTVDIITSGLESAFEFSEPVLEVLTENLLNVDNDKVTWRDVLDEMEKPLRGGSELINVGGI